jgi:hypothetical protein
MEWLIHRSLSVIGDTATRARHTLERNTPCGERPVTNGLKDKQALRALNVPRDRNAGWPTGRKAQGHGVCIVHGEGRRVLREISQGAVREHLCSITSELEQLLRTGEPDALKGARPVRRGADGNALSYETTRKDFGMSKEPTETRQPPTLLDAN